MLVLRLKLRSMFLEGKHFTNSSLPDPECILILKKCTFYLCLGAMEEGLTILNIMKTTGKMAELYMQMNKFACVRHKHMDMVMVHQHTHLQLWNEYANICQTRLLRG